MLVRAVATRRVESGAVKHQAWFRTAVSTYAPPSIKMAAVTSISRAAMRDSPYHRIWGFGAEVERTIAAAGSHVGAAGGGSSVGDAVVGAAKAGAAPQRDSGRGVNGAQRVAAARSDRPRGGGPGRRQGPGWGPEQRDGPKAWTQAEDSGGRVGK